MDAWSRANDGLTPQPHRAPWPQAGFCGLGPSGDTMPGQEGGSDGSEGQRTARRFQIGLSSWLSGDHGNPSDDSNDPDKANQENRYDALPYGRAEGIRECRYRPRIRPSEGSFGRDGARRVTMVAMVTTSDATKSEGAAAA